MKKHRDAIKEKINVENLGIISEDVVEEEGKIYGKLNICSNRECSAALKDNIISKLKKKAELKCPHCKSDLSEDKINWVTFSFEKK